MILNATDFTFSADAPAQQTAPVTLAWDCGIRGDQNSFCMGPIVVVAAPLSDSTKTQEVVTLRLTDARISGTTTFQISQTASTEIFVIEAFPQPPEGQPTTTTKTGPTLTLISSSSNAPDEPPSSSSLSGSLTSSSVLETASSNQLNDQRGPSNKSGAIVGGVVGALLPFLLLILLVLFIRKRRRNSFPYTWHVLSGPS
ncbi:hypothetical protein K435DRAFT_798490 [Dendrothele bispora CBS 962.96]|uniref:Mid2 domain-containing protein n=1 Tax=Dendrothele bispora (strain CBS 962.96) TaxID=1314807 RepID=A0A4S8LYZ1_DENBC|nr:hypothetical protein K435DRAFT_798490 [Dendrothele bispora CBS 962.96]